MTMLVDAHAHLDDDQYRNALDAVVARAAEAGIGAILTAGVTVESSRQAIAIAEKYPNVWAAVGIHPHHTNAASPDDLDALRALAGHEKVVAIGEIGLDYYRDWSPKDVQQRLFTAQLDLATELNLPVCIHARNAYEDVLSELERWISRGAPSRLGMLHCFAGTLEQARRGLELGIKISIAGPVTYPKTEEMSQVVRGVPLESLLTETDSPYLAPQNVRGRRNEPAHVTAVARRIAELRGVDLEEVADCTAKSARTLFRIPE